MATRKWTLTVGSDSVVVSADLAQASAPIRIDGEQTQYQVADARHDVERMMRLCADLIADPRLTEEEWDEHVSYEEIEEET